MNRSNRFPGSADALRIVVLAVLIALPSAQGQTLPAGTPLLEGDALRAFLPAGRQQELAKLEIVPVQGQPFASALRISTSPGATTEWNVQLIARPVAPVASGEVVMASFWMRCAESMTGEGFVGLVFEESQGEFQKAVDVRFAATGQWKQYFMPFRAARDFPADESQICLRVGFDRQTIEIGGIEITNLGRSVNMASLPRTTVSYTGRAADAPWRQEALQRIEKIRKGDLVVQVNDRAGNPVENANVRVVLRRHAFGFGSCVTVDNLLDTSPDGDRYREIVEKYFNRAVFENDMKWPAVYDGIPPRLDQALSWLLDRKIEVRGHNLVWSSWRWLPRPLREFENDPAELRRITAEHITRTVGHFRGKLIHWDVVNEPFSNHDLIDILGGNPIMVEWFKLAHEADPSCGMYLNDYGILESNPQAPHPKHFYDTIKFLKDNGAPIHGIGIQSHFAAVLPPPTQVLSVLDHFSQFGLPIELTELSLNTPDRPIQADYMRDFMIAAFSHPNVNGVMLWGFWERRHWRPQGALFNADWTPRPHALQWIDLVDKQWKTEAALTTDASGAAKVRGFCGTYDVIVSVGDKSTKASADLPRDGARVIVVLQ